MQLGALPSNKDDAASTGGQTQSLFNEKKENRFLSVVDNYDYADDDPSLMDRGSESYNLTSRRSSIYDRQRRGSFHSMLVADTLKFLNDDTDVLPTRRIEPLLANSQFKTSPPSEVYNLMAGRV
jgi:hypothetical protein